MIEIALALSGGGYRAALYHLGALSYLSQLNHDDLGCLLDYVHTISGVSGGAITAIYFARAEARKEPRSQTIKELYQKIVDNNLAKLTFQKIEKNVDGHKSIIQCLSDVYGDIFFGDDTFGELMDFAESGNLHHIFADATDFENGLPFRFQASKKIQNPSFELNDHGLIGNRKNQIPMDIARKIKLRDIIASSSCFPVAFEPIVFPRDFDMNVEDKEKFPSSWGLMDGGVVDNQAIDPILRTNEQLAKDKMAIDIMMISDVSSLDMDGYVPLDINNISYTLDSIKDYFLKWMLEALILAIVFGGLRCRVIVGMCFSFALIFGIGYICIIYKAIIEKGMPKWIGKLAKIDVYEYIKNKFGFEPNMHFLWTIRLDALFRVIGNRIKAAYIMANSVMMGNTRRLMLNFLYGSSTWKDKIVLDAAYMLKEEGTWTSIVERNGFPKDLYNPSMNVMDNSDLVMRMPTSLWFTEQQKNKGLPQALFACGQYTICWNLLCLIGKIENNKNTYNTASMIDLLKYKKQLESDWVAFKRNPIIMVEQFIK